MVDLSKELTVNKYKIRSLVYSGGGNDGLFLHTASWVNLCNLPIYNRILQMLWFVLQFLIPFLLACELIYVSPKTRREVNISAQDKVLHLHKRTCKYLALKFFNNVLC